MTNSYQNLVSGIINERAFVLPLQVPASKSSNQQKTVRTKAIQWKSDRLESFMKTL